MNLKYYNIPTAVYFLIAAALIVYLYPREGKFRYQFNEGKPWRYGLLTAPGDFPVFKTDEEVKQEQDSLMKGFSPYYRIDSQVATDNLDKLRNDINTSLKYRMSSAYLQYLENSLEQLYQKGIMFPEDFESLRKEKYDQIHILENNVSSLYRVSGLFTIRSAYEFIMNNAPSHLSRPVLQSCNIDNYLAVNVAYDEVMTERMRSDMLNAVSLSKGMIQSGERIVDRGEIVDGNTYNVLRSLKIVYETRSGGTQRHGLMLGGIVLYVAGLILCFWLYLWSFRKNIFYNKRDVFFLVSFILMSCVLTELIVRYGLFNIYILPFAIVPVVIRVFFDSRTAMFTHLVIVLICSPLAPFPHEFLFLQIVAGMVVMFSLKDLAERSQLFRCSFFIFLSYALCYFGLFFYQEGDYNKINWMMMLYFGINFILLMFAYVFIYVLEKIFGYVSGISLVELSNINNPLLKKLSETAPGTFQHSLQVSILASEAALKIDANAQLVRTGAMYHDIGKMANPVFFTENQASVNPHDQLSLEQSAGIIIAHVMEGVRLAEKAGLPEAVINFIRTHHGCGITKYFYNTFRNRYPGQEPDREKFTYPGPNPFSKETAVLMMADSVEAASRSLGTHTEEEIQGLVNHIVDGQLADGFLKDAPITFRDVETVKRVFIEKLKIMYHTRISYPELNKESEVDDQPGV